MNGARFVIVGAGPAGMRAAERLVTAGQRPVVIDESPRFGGQIYRQPPSLHGRSRRDLYGFESGRASAVLDRFDSLLPKIDYRPGTLAWHAEPGKLQLQGKSRADELAFDALILATGATDRVLPFPGWTLPGVFTLGAAQVALKYQACVIGPRVVFAGTGPLLYLVAWQYARHGGQVSAVLDTAPARAKLGAASSLMARPSVAAKGAFFLAALRFKGVPLFSGVTLTRADGDVRVEAMRWHRDGVDHLTPCDALAFGHGLRSETQLADLMGCEFSYDDVDQAWLPRHDATGRSSVRGVYLAGDGVNVLGADAAELSGARAAMAALEDFSSIPSSPAAKALENSLHRHTRFRWGLERAFALPADWAANASDDLIVCRCEEVTAGDLRACVASTGASEINRLKAFTRIGMGRCQGRVCAPAASRLLAEAAGCTLREVGRLRAQAPVKPLPIAMFEQGHSAASAVPEDQRDD